MTKPHLFHKYFTSEEVLLLQANPQNDLSSEINLIYILFLHLMEIQQSAPLDLETRIHVLRTYQILADQLVKLMRINNFQNDQLAKLNAEMEEALIEVRQELGIDEIFVRHEKGEEYGKRS